MENQQRQASTAGTFNRGALRMTVTLLRGLHPQLALTVQNQMINPLNPQPEKTPSPKDNFNICLPALTVRLVVENLQLKGDQPQADPGMKMLIKALIIDWINYANLLIELESNKNA